MWECDCLCVWTWCERVWLQVDFHLVQNVARATFSFCHRSSRMEPSRNPFNFNNRVVARATFCTEWKSTLRLWVRVSYSVDVTVTVTVGTSVSVWVCLSTWMWLWKCECIRVWKCNCQYGCEYEFTNVSVAENVNASLAVTMCYQPLWMRTYYLPKITPGCNSKLIFNLIYIINCHCTFWLNSFLAVSMFAFICGNLEKIRTYGYESSDR